MGCWTTCLLGCKLCQVPRVHSVVSPRVRAPPAAAGHTVMAAVPRDFVDAFTFALGPEPLAIAFVSFVLAPFVLVPLPAPIPGQSDCL